MLILVQTRLADWLANFRFIASLFPGSGQVRQPPSNTFLTLSSPSELKTNRTHWSASSFTRHPSPCMDFRSNKALAESSSASAPSILANLFPLRRPSPAPLPPASSLFVCASL